LNQASPDAKGDVEEERGRVAQPERRRRVLWAGKREKGRVGGRRGRLEGEVDGLDESGLLGGVYEGDEVESWCFQTERRVRERCTNRVEAAMLTDA
jgi:hypothetical protein